MIVTRRHLPRRMFLKGMGAVIALPALDAMTPAFAARVARRRNGAAPLRLAFVYVPNGVTMADWTPKTAGADFEYSRILKPLEPFRKDTVVLSGLAHKNGNALGDGPGDHARAGASYLTGVHPKKTAGADILNGISVDQVAAQASRPDRRAFPRSSSAATTRAPSATATPDTRAPTPTVSPGADRRRRCRPRPIRASSSSGCSAISTPACRRKPARGASCTAAASSISSPRAPRS